MSENRGEKMKYRGLELKLRKMVEKRLREGWDVRPGGIFVSMDETQCCAVGSIVAGEVNPRTVSIVDEVCSRLGLSEDDLLSISDGFEGFRWDWRNTNEELHAIGVRIRRHYCETK